MAVSSHTAVASHLSGWLTAVLLMTVIIPGARGQTFLNCFEYTMVDPPTFNITPLAVDQLTAEPSSCFKGCNLEGFQYVGFVEGMCTCSNDNSISLQLFTASVCTKLCNGLECGTDTADVIAIYGPEVGAGNNVPMFVTLAYALPEPPTIKISPDSMNVDLYFGRGAPPFQIITEVLPLPFMPYLIPGTYEVTVVGPNEVWSDTVKIAFLNDAKSVDCPFVMEADVPHTCNFTFFVGNDLDSFTVDISTSISPEASYQLTNMSYSSKRIGDPIPFGNSSSILPSGDLMTTKVIFNDLTYDKTVFLDAIEFYAMEDGEYTVEIVRPTCSAGTYCSAVGDCAEDCPYSLEDQLYTCEAPNIFCPLKKNCEVAADTCAEGTGSVTWESVFSDPVIVAGAPTGIRKNIFPIGPYLYYPGDAIRITGNLGINPESMPHTVTLDDGVRTSKQYLVNIVIVEDWEMSVTHTCTIVNSDLSVTVSSVRVSSSNSSKCERNITDIMFEVTDENVDPNYPELNVQTPYYIWAGPTFVSFYLAKFTVAGPIDFLVSYDPPTQINLLHQELSDFPYTEGSHHIVNIPFSIDLDGVYSATMNVSNSHNLYYESPNDTIIIHALYPVLQIWTMTPRTPKFLVPPVLPTFDILPTDPFADFPTNATIEITWDDGSDTEIYPFTDPPTFSHLYTDHGIYYPEAVIYNEVSKTSVNCTVTIYEEIQDFEIFNGYFMSPTASTDKVDQARPAFGKLKNQYPMDKNLTFFPSLTQGTIEIFEVTHTGNGSLIFDFSPTDLFDPLVDHFQYHFEFEVFLNITVTAKNELHSVSIDLFLEIVGQVRVLKINDYAITNKFDEDKFFEISFESVGGGTCLILNWGDSPILEAYGEELVCAKNFSHAVFNPDIQLDITMNFTHNYKPVFDGQLHTTLNVSGFAYNMLSQTEDMLMFPITDLDCSPPIVEIADQMGDFQVAEEVFMAEDNGFLALGTIDCSISKLTKKRWQIFEVDSESGLSLFPVFVKDILPSWNKPELVIPARFLPYGYYKLLVTHTLLGDFPPELIFQSQANHYIEIIKSPLIGRMTSNSISKIRRGFEQQVILEPAVHSEDPDFPDVKNFTIAWKCRKLSETYPADEVPTLVSPLGAGDGCFGNGVGSLDYLERHMELLGADFIDVGDYEVLAVVRKDTRSAEAIIHLEIVVESVPEVKLFCITENLCQVHPTEMGVIVNPTSRLAMIAECTDECEGDLVTEWKAWDDANNDLVIPGDITSSEMVLETDTFFDANPGLSNFNLQATITNGAGKEGSSIYYFIVNQPPDAPYHDPTLIPQPALLPTDECLVYPGTGRALVDTFTITCDKWFDPDNIGLVDYRVELVYSSDGDPSPPSVLFSQSHSSTGQQIFELIFPPATFDVNVVITDEWGAFTKHASAVDFTADMITEEEYNDANIDDLVDTLAGAGNTALLNQVIAAQSAVNMQAPWLNLTDPNLSPEELEARQRLLSQMYEKQLNLIKDSTNFEDYNKASGAATATASIMEAVSASPEAAMTLGLNSRGLVADILEGIGHAAQNADISDMNAMDSLVVAIETISAGMVQNFDDHLANKDCLGVSPSDYDTADTLQYDTEITGIDMIVPGTVKEAKGCNIKELTKDSATSMMDRANAVVEQIGTQIMGLMVKGDRKIIVSPNGMTMGLAMVDGFKLEGLWHCGLCTYTFPVGFCPQGTGKCSIPVGVMCKEWPAVNYQAPETSSKLARGSLVLDLDILTRDMDKIEVNNTEKAMYIGIYRTPGKRGSMVLPDFEFINATYESYHQIIPVMYSKFVVSEEISSISIELKPDKPESNLFLILSKDKMPSLQNHHYYTLIRDLSFIDSDIQEMFIGSKEMIGPGTYYLGIGEYSEFMPTEHQYSPNERNFTDIRVPMSVNYHIRIFSSACYYRHTGLNQWIHGGMEVVKSNHSATSCETHHLTSFGAGFHLKPSTIDFSFALVNLGFVDNLTIYMALIVCFISLILFLLWARYKDRKDEEKVGLAPLPENKPNDLYLYELIVKTGDKKEAQTDSTVQFLLCGEYADSEIMTLSDERRTIFRRNDKNAFVMACNGPLGPMNYLRIWHDNSGKGPNGSWFLNYVVVRDVQTGDKFEFICDDWLSVEKPGTIDRFLYTALSEDKESFKHLCKNVGAQSIAENHLWLSIFCRSFRSRFTRCQRVGTCWAMLFLTMLVNAIFYSMIADTTREIELSIGPFNITKVEAGVGLFCDMIVFLPTLLIVFLFKYSKPRVLRDSRLDLAIEEMQEKKQNETAEEENSEITEVVAVKEDDQSKKVIPEKHLKKLVFKKKEPKKKFGLPFFCAYIAWLLVIVIILASVFFLLMYAIMMGANKTAMWLTSMALSFFASVLIFQPLKIFLITIFFSSVCKAKDLDEDDVEHDEKPPTLLPDQEWLYDERGRKKGKMQHETADPETVARLAKKRKQEKEMHEIMKELAVYAVFIWVLLTLTYSHRDANAWYLRENLRHSFIHDGFIDGSDFNRVLDSDTLWEYLHKHFFPFLRADVHYNGKAPYQLRGFLNDQANRIMGYPTIRQIRAKKNTCPVPVAMRGMTVDCTSYTQIENEETHSYCAGWKLPKNGTGGKKGCRITEFRYSTPDELDALPFWGQRDWYSGGGYVIHLKAKTDLLLKLFTYLQRKHWIDHLTRSILIEFSTYNSGANLFGVATLMAEFLPGGGIAPNYRFDGVRLTQNQQSQFFIFIVQILFAVFTIYFTLRELFLLYKKKRKYFDSYWTYAEIMMIIACYAAIILHVFRQIETDKALKTFSRTYGNGYIRLTYAVTLNEYYSYTLAFMVFVGMLKFIKILRFNKKIGILSATLRQCWDDLSGFMIAFFLCFFSFVFLFYVLLHKSVDDFYHIVTAIETSFSMMLGKFDFQEMRAANPLVPLLFFVFVLCNSWVLVNLLLTLIIQSFEQVKRDMMKQPDDFQMVEFIWKTFRGLIRKNKSGTAPPKDALKPTLTSNKGSDQEKLTDLPDKMDSFLDYINEMYFNNTLNWDEKKSMRRLTKRQREQFGQGEFGPFVGE